LDGRTNVKKDGLRDKQTIIYNYRKAASLKLHEEEKVKIYRLITM
jgi:hypothetical protein